MKWLLYFIPAVLIEALAWLLTPFVCLFVVSGLRTDYMKRLGGVYMAQREFLPGWLSYFQTHDNAVDEYWWGRYNENSFFLYLRDLTSLEYEQSRWARYLCRCMWLFRNTAYGFHYAWFSVPAQPEDVRGQGVKGEGFWWRLRMRASSWQLQYQIPIPFTRRYIDGNIGWKGHDGFDRMMYANRVIGLRQYQQKGPDHA